MGESGCGTLGVKEGWESGSRCFVWKEFFGMEILGRSKERAFFQMHIFNLHVLIYLYMGYIIFIYTFIYLLIFIFTYIYIHIYLKIK